MWYPREYLKMPSARISTARMGITALPTQFVSPSMPASKEPPFMPHPDFPLLLLWRWLCRGSRG